MSPGHADGEAQTISVRLRQVAEDFAQRDAIVHALGRLRYAEVEAESARLARGLLAVGVGKGTRVALLLPNRPDWLVAWLAIVRIGAVAVPINTFFKARELGWMLRHADVAVLLTAARFLSHDYLARLEEIAPALAQSSAGALRLPELPYLRSVWVFREGQFFGEGQVSGEGDRAFGERDRPWARPVAALTAAADAEPLVDEALLRAVEADVAASDPAVLLYSSGSTAEPKGAIHGHGTLLRHSAELAALRELTPEDRIWSPMPFFWVGGLVFSLLSNLQAGACGLCEDVFDPEATLALLENERATIAIGWPHFGKALAEHPTRPSRDLSTLCRGNMPGLLPAEQVPDDPELRANALGMTETCGAHTWAGEGALPESLRGSFGPGIGGFEHRVVDPGSGAALPPGELGEIYVRGPRLMQGLHKREREAVFDADGWYPTGDAGFFDAAGVLYFKGRLGDMIKTGGANVSPPEVEAVLLAQAEVKAAQIVGIPDPDRGETVVAAVVLEDGQAASADELKGRVAKELAAYKVPRRVFFFAATAELPQTDTGKPDKRSLRALLGERAREGGAG